MKDYFSRFIKYLIFVVLLFAVVYIILALTGYSRIPLADFGSYMIHDRGGWTIIIMVVVIAAIYPIVTKSKTMTNPIPADDLVKMMEKVGYGKTGQEGETVYYFRPVKFGKRMMLKFDDIIKAEFVDDGIIFSGSRKSLLRSAHKVANMHWKNNRLEEDNNNNGKE